MYFLSKHTSFLTANAYAQNKPTNQCKMLQKCEIAQFSQGCAISPTLCNIIKIAQHFQDGAICKIVQTFQGCKAFSAAFSSCQTANV
jgi:hypothetical protein